MSTVKKETPVNNYEAFRDHIKSIIGWDPGEIKSDNQFNYFLTKDRIGNRAGYYKFDGSFGIFGDFRQGGEAQYWFADKKPSKAQRKAQELKIEKARAELELLREKAARKVQQEFAKAPPHDPQHLYLRKKDIELEGIRQVDDRLLIPIYNEEGYQTSVQRIDETGAKYYEKWGKIRGSFFSIGEGNSTIIIAEGIATGASLHAFTDERVIVALSANNLEPVAEIFRRKYPSADIIIAVDDDKDSAGEVAAREAASKTGAKLSIPPFDRKLYPDNKEYNDWNDYANHYGNEVSKKAFYDSLSEEFLIDWRSHAVKEKERIICNAGSVLAALRYEPVLRGVVGYDLMLRREMLLRSIPGQLVEEPRPLTDEDVTKIMVWLQKNGMAQLGKTAVWDAVLSFSRENSYNPVVEYLSQLHWDGVKRLELLFPNYFGAENTEWTRMVSRAFLISAVARIFVPGCQNDYTVILEGLQGRRKSSGVRALGSVWYTDSMPSLNRDKECSQHLRGKWFVELPELAALERVSSEDTKKFLTRREEVYRPAYGRLDVHEPRTCIFVGTTNEREYLKDPTGGRRYWPVRCGEVLVDRIIEDRDQLFAEAVFAYRAGEKWYFDRQTEEQYALGEQKDRQEGDLWQEHIVGWLIQKTKEHNEDPDNSKKPYRITQSDLAVQCLGLPVGQLLTNHRNRLTKILLQIGWERSETQSKGRHYWLPPSNWPEGWTDVEESYSEKQKQLEMELKKREAERLAHNLGRSAEDAGI